MLETIQVTEHQPKLGEFGYAGDDHVVPFEVGPLDVRGRAVQLGPMLDAILGRHDYPEPVARLLAEACVLTVLLGTSLKFEGKFILQTRTDGPVDMLVADFSTPACAARLCALRRRPAGGADRRRRDRRQQTLLGSGVLALTIDQGAHTQRYQGIVAARRRDAGGGGAHLFPPVGADPDRCQAVGRQAADARRRRRREQWRAGGMLAQFLPQAPERMRVPDLPGGDGDPRDEIARADRQFLAGSCRRCSAPSSRPN